MGLFKKKKDIEENQVSLPDLPELEEDMSLPSINDLNAPANLPDLEINNLSTLDSQEENLDQNTIKSAITPPIPKPLNNNLLPQTKGMQKSKFKVVESPYEGLPVKIGNKIPEIHPNTSTPTQNFDNSHTKEIEPIYVRLDKFQTTVGAFQEIKTKVEDIEKLLTKIKEIKEKEERELIEWENEIQIIKSRIESVDKNIFDKLG
ncbi:hypothetical protein HOE04_00065 [archaeon]|jgi:hypothetical protein|nr:hypothetical protein [archaeon]